ncbi:MAG: polyphenol oxidase family protein [Chthoniobacterales bacterium]
MAEAARSAPVEHFPALAALPGFVHAFVVRVPGVDARHDKEEALRRLDVVHRQMRSEHNVGGIAFLTADQVHGSNVETIDDSPTVAKCFAACDGLITNLPDICLGIYVADCCAVYLVDPVRKCIGIVHSGKKGSELGIAGRAIDLMTERYGSQPSDLVVQLSPCIRPPHYEVDFAAEILRVCQQRGVQNIHDAGICTACDLDRYYSYRAEKGKTGRMLAFLAIKSDQNTH